MVRTFLNALRRGGARRACPPRFFPTLDALETRLTPAVTASYSAVAKTLTVNGDAAGNVISVSRNAGGTILVNNGAVAVSGGAATVTNTLKIVVLGNGGNDDITLGTANGGLIGAFVVGGAGNDELNGGTGADTLSGGSGNDTLRGNGANDRLEGQDGHDDMDGGNGNDQALGSTGNDKVTVLSGKDTVDGGSGTDTFFFQGTALGDNLTVAAAGAKVFASRTNNGPASADLGGVEAVVVNGLGGNDTVSGGLGLASLVSLTLDGGVGNDSLLGGDGNDVLLGGDGNDTVAGNGGNDAAFLGAGNDTFAWEPGDGNDTVEGQAGSDTLRFTGSDAGEIINVSANGPRARFTRDVDAVTTDLNDVERVYFDALGGADTITVNDLFGTDVTRVDIDLAAGPGGDALIDRVIVNATAGDDALFVSGSAAGVNVQGLAAQVNVLHAESLNDRLVVNGLAGADALLATDLAAAVIDLELDGGDGFDFGENGETLIGIEN